MGVIIGLVDQSAVMLAFGLECMVDCFSSAVIIWRFRVVEFEAPAKREARASVCIAFTFVLTGVLVLVDAIVHLEKSIKTENEQVLLGITIPSAIILVILGYIKIYWARKLGSQALFDDGTSSFGSALLASGTFMGIFAQMISPSLWWADSAFAITIALGLLFYGLLVLTKHDWMGRKFWKGDSRREIAASDDNAFDSTIDSSFTNYKAGNGPGKDVRAATP
jgi:divalent metal cation (Fe/Co/Zn/Cd) transporter